MTPSQKLTDFAFHFGYLQGALKDIDIQVHFLEQGVSTAELEKLIVALNKFALTFYYQEPTIDPRNLSSC